MTQFDPPAKIGIGGFFFGIYAWLMFVLCVISGIVFALVLPGIERRRRWVTSSARATFWLTRIPVEVHGMEHLPVEHCVVVANHASYVDGVVLFGYLPPRFAFVIKGEMKKFPAVNILLRRIGAKFVERFDASGSARDARHLLRAASSGESLAVFPEGTFKPHPGLDRFRPGAFAAAINAEVPVVPTVITGSRYVYPAGRILPQHGVLRIDILQAIQPGDPAFADSAALAQLSRRRILDVLDEPDLLA